jgi:hypothetical protein
VIANPFRPNRELEFRDGKREVADYLYPVLSRLDTYTMTYAEAIQAANRLMERDFVSDAMHAVRVDHFRRSV